MANIPLLNTSAGITGKTALLADAAGTITALHTFDRDPSAPFAVSAGSAYVANLDADKLDGYEATAFLLKAGGTMVGNLLFTDNTYDIGASGATRPRDLFLARNAVIGGTLTLGGNVLSDLLFTDATYDIGKTGATRPRDLFLSRNAVIGGTLDVTGNATYAGTLRVGPAGAASLSPVEFVGTGDGVGVAITTTSTAAADGCETYVAGFLKNASGTLVKWGALAFKVADKTDATGYGSFNIHTTAFTAGVSADYIDYAQWAKGGIELFGNSSAAAAAPGNAVLRVKGKIVVGASTPDTLLHIWKASAGTVSARSEAILTLESDVDTALQFLTPNNKTQYIFFGDADASNAGWISFDHATDTLAIRVGGSTVVTSTSALLTLPIAVQLQTIGAFAAGDKYLIVDASGNVHKSATGPAS